MSLFPTYHKIAVDAFNAGFENAKQPNLKKLEKELKETKKELKELWDALKDVDRCGELIAGF